MKDKQEKRLDWEMAVDTWSFNKNLAHPLTNESVKIFIRAVEQEAVAEERARIIKIIDSHTYSDSMIDMYTDELIDEIEKLTKKD